MHSSHQFLGLSSEMLHEYTIFSVFVISQPTLVFYPCFPHWFQIDVAQLGMDDLKSDPITHNIATFESKCTTLVGLFASVNSARKKSLKAEIKSLRTICVFSYSPNSSTSHFVY